MTNTELHKAFEGRTDFESQETLLRQEAAIDAMNEIESKVEYKERPDCNGWWFWFESGLDDEGEPRRDGVPLLITANGEIVAPDDEWGQATGLNLDELESSGWSYNYWESTYTTQKMMPGVWVKAPDDFKFPFD